MDLEKLVNQTVIHKSFGKGIIRSVDEKYLEVDFTEKGKVSKFPYPGCFHGFLTIEDGSLQSEIITKKKHHITLPVTWHFINLPKNHFLKVLFTSL